MADTPVSALERRLTENQDAALSDTARQCADSLWQVQKQYRRFSGKAGMAPPVGIEPTTSP